MDSLSLFLFLHFHFPSIQRKTVCLLLLLLLLLLLYFIDFVREKNNFSFQQSLRRRSKLLLNCVIIIHRNERVSEWCVNTLTTSSCEHTSIWFLLNPLSDDDRSSYCSCGTQQQRAIALKQNKTKHVFLGGSFSATFFLSFFLSFFTWNF